ncbi:MAG: hypothetical protein JRJ15_14830 [Deltaproteobacteria bacterium]|nr:hypothetical protein [Deltaproteobacteria bacterium]
MDLKFNIIFVPGTVRYMRLAVLSLLKHSSYTYRLIANGLDSRECALLVEFCRKSDRLEYFYYPSKRVLEHGMMLNLLFQRESSPYFCMADSDIFAMGPFEEELERHLQECDVLSSCLTLDMDPSDVLSGFLGICLKTPGGLPLAPTFLSVYRTDLFRKIIAETKIGFEAYRPTVYLPESVKDIDLPDNLEEPSLIDTGKLLNILASQYGARFRHCEFPNFIHIGGISNLRVSKREKMKEILRGFLKRPYALTDEYLRSEMRRRSRGKSLRGQQGTSNRGQADARLRVRALRNPLAMYFKCLFQSLFDGTPEPLFKLSDERLRQSVNRTSRLIRDIYNEEYGGQKAE